MTMTSSSAGSRPNSEQFLSASWGTQERRIPGSGDTAMKGEVRNDIVGKVDREFWRSEMADRAKAKRLSKEHEVQQTTHLT